jgi:hypothetical protein
MARDPEDGMTNKRKTARVIFRTDSETVRRGKKRAKALRFSWSEYLRRLLEADAEIGRWWNKQ